MNQKLLLTLFAVFLSVFCMNAQKSQTVNVVDAGTLATLLGADKTTVTDLTLTGTINNADFTTIKQMTALKSLDMLNVDIMNGTIPASAFAGRVMDKLVLSKSLKTIGNNSFQAAILSQSLELPSTVELIGTQAFKGASLKGGLILSESLRTIQHGAFWGVKVPSLNFDNSPNLEEMQYYVFVDAQIGDNLVDLSTCTNLKRFTTNNRDQGTFYNYTGHVTLPVDLIDLPALTFSHFQGELVLSKSLKTIGNNAFEGAVLSQSLKLPSTVELIGSQAFKGASLKGGLILSESLRTIQHGAFWGVKVPSLNFDNSPNLEEMQYYVFVDAQIGDNLVDLSTCTNLKRFTNNYRDQGTFYNYTGHVTLPDDLKLLPSLTFSRFCGLVDLSLKLQKIEDRVFANSTIEEIELPRSVTYIGSNAFANCSNLSKIISINPVPPVLGNAVFSGVDANNCTLVVPDRGLEAYATADQWKDFISTMRSVSGLRATDLKLNEDIDQAETVISVYPNPTTDVLNVKGENVESISVYSVSGRLVKSVTKANTINLQDLSSGVYIVKITTPAGVTSERVMKK